MFFLFEEEEVQEVWDSRWQYVKKIGIGNMKRELRQQIEDLWFRERKDGKGENRTHERKEARTNEN